MPFKFHFTDQRNGRRFDLVEMDSNHPQNLGLTFEITSPAGFDKFVVEICMHGVPPEYFIIDRTVAGGNTLTINRNAVTRISVGGQANVTKDTVGHADYAGTLEVENI